MKKTFRRIAGLVTAIAVLSVASASLWAAPGDPAELDQGTGKVETDNTKLYIPKSINVTNPENITVYSPAITYSYTIEPATVATTSTVTDANDRTSAVKAGIANGAALESATIAFTSTAVTANSADNECEQNLQVNVDLSVFETANAQPGIYRYKITDTTTDATLHTAGIERSADYETVRYLDVYLKRDATSGYLVVYGYALFDGAVLDADNDGTTEVNVDKDTAKSNGYIWASEGQGALGQDQATLTDTYDTYNVRIEKVVTGEMGDTSHEFPFTIGVTKNVSYTNFFAGENGTLAETSTTPLSTTLKNGDYYEIKGLSPLDLVTVSEQNDTYDTYTVTVSNTAGNVTGKTSVAVAHNGTLAATDNPFQVSTYSTTSTYHGVSEAVDMDSITYTNNLEAISPTGVIIRTLPYIAIVLLAGAMLVTVKVLNKSEKKEKSESAAE